MSLDERKFLPLLLAGALVLAGAVVYLDGSDGDVTGVDDNVGPVNNDKLVPGVQGVADVNTFSSKEEFKQYLLRASSSDSRVYLGQAQAGGDAVAERETTADAAPAEGDGGDGGRDVSNQDALKDADAQEFQNRQQTDVSQQGDVRFSGTNVQEEGIDEPDILKIGDKGDTFFFSPSDTRHRKYPERFGEVSVIDSRPAKQAAEIANINASGNLLLVGDTLVVMSNKEIKGYDVSDRESPKEKWDMKLKSSVETARLLNGKVYLVLKERVNRENPCPVKPLETGSGDLTIRCDEIYHPSEPVNVDVTYSIISFDPQTGSVEDKTSFVGSSENSVVYMSRNSLYITYTTSKDRSEILLDFLLGESRDLLDTSVIQRLEEIRSYNLSSQARMVEVRNTVRQWLNSLNENERMRIENEIENRYEKYVENHKREFESTGIVEISVGGSSLDVENTGKVPGRPLNQFSMDEHDGNLRIATTIAGRFGRTGGQSENDLYVLDDSLDITGSVKGMGVTERIYSVRFIGDKGYIVTFRRIDPFHVLDLSDPSNPKLEGELKLPGFSSYLHPLSEDKILGIGEEDGEVKAVIFDVSNPTNPTVEDDYKLNDRWSEVSKTHHAFLLDKKHEVFFLPGSRGGYVFSYDGGLSLKKTVKMEQARRAAYVGDYMYILANKEMVVLDETTWKIVNRQTFGEGQETPPKVSWDFDQNSGPVVTITHAGGEKVDGNRIDLKIRGGASTTWTQSGGTNTITAGDSVQIGPGSGVLTSLSAGDTLQLVWTGKSGDSTVLGEYEVP